LDVGKICKASLEGFGEMGEDGVGHGDGGRSRRAQGDDKGVVFESQDDGGGVQNVGRESHADSALPERFRSDVFQAGDERFFKLVRF
jgi:hypothetical protein